MSGDRISVQTAYIYGKMNGIDIREYGSGNAGTTNALRVLGKKAGVIVLLGDVAKTVLAVVLVKVIFARTHGDMLPLLGMYAAAGAILGHNFPVQLGFRGGKGIACTAGLVLTLGPIVTILEAVTFLLTVGLTRYVSLGSILVVIELVIDIAVLGQRVLWNESGTFTGILSGLYSTFPDGHLSSQNEYQTPVKRNRK